MAERIDFERVCSACGARTGVDADRCASCGAALEPVAESPGAAPIDDDPALRYVDPENRTELTRFERWEDAELACGLLRSHGIACELSSMVLPGLPADMILWVNTRGNSDCIEMRALHRHLFLPAFAAPCTGRKLDYHRDPVLYRSYPGADHATRSASSFSAQERTVPRKITLLPSVSTVIRRASVSALRSSASAIFFFRSAGAERGLTVLGHF